MSARPAPLRHVDAIVIGASAGGTEALSVLLPALPSDLDAAVLVVLHQPRKRPSLLVEIFRGKCALIVCEAQDKEPIAAGTLYFAPPDYHMLIEEDHSIALSADGLVRFARPSIDVLFETAADAYGKRLLGIILTGANDDGAAGLRAVREAGGRAIVQLPQDAKVSFMPAAASHLVPDAEQLTLEQMAHLLRTTTRETGA